MNILITGCAGFIGFHCSKKFLEKKNKVYGIDVINDYYNCLLQLFSKKSRIPSNINTQTHIMGYFKKSLSSKEKEHFLKLIELYRNKKTPISSINSLLQSWTIRFENEYLIKQSFLNPFPKELISEKKSRFL